MHGKHPPGPRGYHIHNARLAADQARVDGTTRPTTPGTDMLGPGLDELFTSLAMDVAEADWGARWASLCLEDVDRVAAGHPDASIRERARVAAAGKRRTQRKIEEAERTKAAAEARAAARIEMMRALRGRR